jgi:hypothetical protein
MWQPLWQGFVSSLVDTVTFKTQNLKTVLRISQAVLAYHHAEDTPPLNPAAHLPAVPTGCLHVSLDTSLKFSHVQT